MKRRNMQALSQHRKQTEPDVAEGYGALPPGETSWGKH